MRQNHGPSISGPPPKSSKNLCCNSEQDQGATGVSSVIRWHIGDSKTVLSLMVSVPYSFHLYSSWVSVGLTNDEALPDFSAMYSGTPDSDWFVRQEMGHRLEFTNGDLILLVDSDSSSSKPVVRLSVVPLKTDEVAKSIKYRQFQGFVKGEEFCWSSCDFFL